jgi:4-hydroxy-tetrahydrodipicolinate synthase
MLEFHRKPLEGVFPLMPLPIKGNEEIDYDALEWNIDWLAQRGIPGFIKFGCMGAFNAVSEQEFRKVTDVCVKAAGEKELACVISCTQLNTLEVVRRLKYAEDAGADGGMVALPFAFQMLDPWTVEFWKTLDSSIRGDMALMVYNTVALARGYSISASLWEKDLLELKNIKALKDSDMRINNHDLTLLKVADKINWFSCGDSYFWHDAMWGAKGIVAQLAWVAPKATIKFYNACRKGNYFDPWVIDFQKALVIGFGAMSLAQDGMPPMNPYEHGYLNALAEIGGAKAGTPRKPYGSLSNEVRRKFENELQPLLDFESKI